MAAQMEALSKQVSDMKAKESSRIEEAYIRGLIEASRRSESNVNEARGEPHVQDRQIRPHVQSREFNYELPHSPGRNNAPLFSSPLAVQNIKVVVKQSSPSASIICTAMKGQVPCLASNSPFSQCCTRCGAPLPRDRNFYKDY